MVLRLVGVMNLILIVSHSFNIQGRDSCLCDFFSIKNVTLACIQTFTDWLIKLVLVMEITKLYSLILVWMTLTFVQGQLYIKLETLMSIFSQILG